MTLHFCNDRWGGGGGPGACSRGNVLNYGCLKRYFLHFEGTLKQNIKVLNDIFLQRTSIIVLNNYFSPNEIRLSFCILC